MRASSMRSAASQALKDRPPGCCSCSLRWVGGQEGCNGRSEKGACELPVSAGLPRRSAGPYRTSPGPLPAFHQPSAAPRPPSAAFRLTPAAPHSRACAPSSSPLAGGWHLLACGTGGCGRAKSRCLPPPELVAAAPATLRGTPEEQCQDVVVAGGLAPCLRPLPALPPPQPAHLPARRSPSSAAPRLLISQPCFPARTWHSARSTSIIRYNV